MKNSKHCVTWAIITILAIASFFLLFRVVQSYGGDLFKFILNLKNALCVGDLIGIFSVVIAIISGALAYITYHSIDAVRSITDMEGNVLEIENYSNVYSDIFDKLKGAKNEIEYNRILGEIISKKTKIYDCISFSLHLQRFIDNLMWMNFTESNSFELINKSEKKIIKLAQKAKKFKRINSGLENIFDENIKLIISVLKIHFGKDFMESSQRKTNFLHTWYTRQQYKCLKTKGKNCIGSIYAICGPIFINPVTKMTYHNYLGIKFIEDAIGVCIYQTNTLSFGNMCEIFNKRKRDRKKKLLFLYKANNSLREAKSKSTDNVLWNCICSENYLKLKIIKWLICGASKKTQSKINKEIKTVIKKWRNAYYIFTSIGAEGEMKNSYLVKEFVNRINQLTEISWNISRVRHLADIT